MICFHKALRLLEFAQRVARFGDPLRMLMLADDLTIGERLQIERDERTGKLTCVLVPVVRQFVDLTASDTEVGTVRTTIPAVAAAGAARAAAARAADVPAADIYDLTGDDSDTEAEDEEADTAAAAETSIGGMELRRSNRSTRNTNP
ncbi:MAG: hypothetical protein SGARI_001552, partial [Bacillariaceae sp.]